MSEATIVEEKIFYNENNERVEQLTYKDVLFDTEQCENVLGVFYDYGYGCLDENQTGRIELDREQFDEFKDDFEESWEIKHCFSNDEIKVLQNIDTLFQYGLNRLICICY